ncbi:MAG: GNAT family N-acetyltransferase [Planctomycetota bacterium]|nr:GNAT family N-acetyltransferase [Planctomycetota bacterium]
MEPADFARLAQLEEGRIARGVRLLARDSIDVAGGVACCNEPGWWLNAAFACGLSSPASAQDLDTIIDFFRTRSVEPRVETAPFVERPFLDALANRGFVIRHFENVFYRPLEPGETPAPARTPPPGLTLEIVDPTDERAVDQFARVATSGFLPEGVSEWPEHMLESVRTLARLPRNIPCRAMLEGRCVAAGSIEIDGPIASLQGVSVLPEARRQGVQSALVAFRLAEAARRGARIATISSRPGVATERNAQRAGFRVAYTKVTLVRPEPGMIPAME